MVECCKGRSIKAVDLGEQIGSHGEASISEREWRDLVLVMRLRLHESVIQLRIKDQPQTVQFDELGWRLEQLIECHGIAVAMLDMRVVTRESSFSRSTDSPME